MSVKITSGFLINLDQQIDWNKPALPQLFKTLVPSLFGEGIVEHNSWEGRIFCWWNRDRSIRDQQLELGNIFFKAMESLSQEKAEWNLVPERIRTLLQKQCDQQSSELARPDPNLDKLEEAVEPRATSLLRNRLDKSNEIISDEALSQIMEEELTAESLDILEAFFRKNVHLASPERQGKIAMLKQGIGLRAQLQQQLQESDGRTQEERLEALTNAVYADYNEAMNHADKNKQRFVFLGNYGRKVASVAELFQLTTTESFNLLKRSKMPNFEAIFHEGLVGALFDDKGRKVPDSIKEKIPEFLEKPLDYLFQDGVLKYIQALIPEGEFSDLLGWISENARRMGDPKERDAFLNEPIKRAMEGIDQSVADLFKNIQQVLPPELLDATGFDCKISSGEFWVEVQKQSDGKLTLLIYASGQALLRHSKNGDKLQWPLCFYNVNPKKLEDLNFWHRLVSHMFVPQMDLSFVSSATDIYDMLERYLESPIKPSSEELRLFPPAQMGSLSMAQLMLSSRDIDLGVTSAYLKRESFLSYLCPHQSPNGSLNLSPAANTALLERTAKKLLQGARALGERIPSWLCDSIEATREDVLDAIARRRSAEQSEAPHPAIADLGVPPEMIARLQKFLTEYGVSFKTVRSFREPLRFALGDEIGDLIEVIADGMGAAPSGKVAKATPKTFTYKKGWLLTALTSSYVQIALTVLKYALVAAGVYVANISYTTMALVLFSRDWVLREILPKPIYESYNHVLGTLRVAIRDMIVTIISHCLFSLEETKGLALFAKQWQKVAKMWTRVAMGKEVMAYQLEPMERRELFSLAKQWQKVAKVYTLITKGKEQVKPIAKEEEVSLVEVEPIRLVEPEPFLVHQVSCLLNPIKRFCPISKIKYSIAPDKSRIESLTLNPYGIGGEYTDLQFEVQDTASGNLQAVNVGKKFPGYYIAQKQLNSALRGIGSYLILEKGAKDRKVLIPKEQLISPMLSPLLDKIRLEGPLAHLAEQVIGSFQPNTRGSADKFYVYDMDPFGRLHSEDPEALVYMMLNYILRGKETFALQTCDLLERLSTRESIQGVSQCLLPLFLVSQWNENALFIRKRVFAMMEKNRVKMEEDRVSKGDKVIKGAKRSGSYFDLICGGMVLWDLQNKGSTKLTQLEEWFLFGSAFHYLGKVLPEEVEPEILMQLCFPSALIDRYRDLKLILGKNDAENQSSLSRAICFGVEAIRTSIGTSPGAPASISRYADFSGKFRGLIRAGTFGLFRFNSSNLKKEIDIKGERNAPLNLEALTADKFKEYYLQYYALAKGDGTLERLKKFKELLPLMKGGWNNQTRALVGYLEAVSAFPWLFPSVEKFKDEIERPDTPGKNESVIPPRISDFLGENEEVTSFSIFISDIAHRAFLLQTSSKGLKLGGAALINAAGSVGLAAVVSQVSVWTLGFRISPVARLGGLMVNKVCQVGYRWMGRSPESSNNIRAVDPQAEAFPYASLTLIDDEVDDKLNSLFNSAFEESSKNQALPQEPSGQREFRIKDELLLFKDDFEKGLKRLKEECDSTMAAANSKLKRDDKNPIDFASLLYHLGEGSLETLGPSTGLSKDRLKQLEMSLMGYLVKYTRMQQLERIVGHYEKLMDAADAETYKDTLNAMLNEFQIRRDYTFEDFSPTVLRLSIISEFNVCMNNHP